MICANCNMGFIITPINVKKECPHCGYSNMPLVLEEENMVKKIVKWIWNIIAWPFKKIHNWLNG